MPRLVPLKPREVVRKLAALGFDGPYPGGRHQRMVNLKTGKVIPVPVHKGRDVGVGLQCEIINEVGITRDDWLAL